MNNIQKAFMAKSELRCMANGGVVNRGVANGVPTFSDRPFAGSAPMPQAAPTPPAPVARPVTEPSIYQGNANGVPTFSDRPFAGSSLRGAPTPPAPAPTRLPTMTVRAPAMQEPTRLPTMTVRAPAMQEPTRLPTMTVQAPQQLPTMTITAPPQRAPNDMLAMSSLRRPSKISSYYDNESATEFADGGKVSGKGGPTDDAVGPVMLSDGEYVLPADTVQAIGRDKLDALRDATHTFVKPKSGLRGMANGGGVRNPYMQRALSQGSTASNATLRAAGVPAYDAGLRGAGQRAANFLTSASSSGASLNPFGTAATRQANLAQMGPARAAVNMGGGRLAGLARGSLPVAALVGAKQSFDDVRSGYRDQFNTSVGLDGAGSSIAGDALRVASNVGDAATFGIAGRLGRGISNLASGQSFGEGFMSDSDRDQFNQQQMNRVVGVQASAGQTPAPATSPLRSTANAPSTTVLPESYQSRRLAEMGVPVDVQNSVPVTEDARRNLIQRGGGTQGQFVNLGNYGGDSNIYGSASTPGGKINNFVGVGASARPDDGGPRTAPEDPLMAELRSALRGSGGTRSAPVPASNARDINARFDKLASDMRGMYGPKGQGNLARRMMELEQSRNSALDADARNQSSLRGQDMQAATAANSANAQSRLRAMEMLTNLSSQREANALRTQGVQASTQAAQLKALQEAQNAAAKGEEQGVEAINAAIGKMFTDPETNKPNRAEQEAFTSFVLGSDPQASEKLAAMGAQDRNKLLEDFKVLFAMSKEQNAAAARAGGAVTNRAAMPVDVREAAFSDFWNDKLSGVDYLRAFVQNPNVMVDETGQAVLMEDVAKTNGNWDADKLNLIEQRTGKDRDGKRSALRGN